MNSDVYDVYYDAIFPSALGVWRDKYKVFIVFTLGPCRYCVRLKGVQLLNDVWS